MNDKKDEEVVDVQPYEGPPDFDRSQFLDGGRQDDDTDPENETFEEDDDA